MGNSANASPLTRFFQGRRVDIVISCEHGGNAVPREYARLFKGKEALLASHKGLDPGSYVMAKNLAISLDAVFCRSKTSRLLVDLNRSAGHPALFSTVTRKMPREERLRILERYYHPHRKAVEGFIEDRIIKGRNVLHIAVHTFAPVLRGVKRKADAGLLYDPSRAVEKEFCARLRKELAALDPRILIRRNYPYLGVADGLATHLRKRHPGSRYLGMELEINQKHPLGDRACWKRLQRDIIAAVKLALCPDTGRNAQRRA